MPRKKKTEPRSITELSYAVAEVLRGPSGGDDVRFKVMDLAEEIIQQADLQRDSMMRQTLWSWIGKVQSHVGLQ